MNKYLKNIRLEKFLLLSGVSIVLTSVPLSLVLAQEMNTAPTGIASEALVSDSDVVPNAIVIEAPSEDVLNDLESQLEDLERVLQEANAEIDESGLPVIDPENEPDIFYDSMPVRRGVQPTAPEKVDPLSSPAGKIIHVSKNFESDSQQAILVTAKRALSLGRYDSALEFYNQLYKKNKRDPRVLMGRAIALQKMGRVQTAIEAYEDLLKVQPNNLEAEISMLGLVKERFPALALKRMLELYDSKPNDSGLNSQIGMAYASIGNTQDAMRYLGMAVSLEPNNASYFYNLAIISDRAGDVKQAIKFYEESLSKDTLYGASRSVPREVIYERLSVIRQRS